MSEHEKTYSPEEAAEILRVHRRTVYRWIKNKKIRPLPRIGRNIAIPASELGLEENGHAQPEEG